MNSHSTPPDEVRDFKMKRMGRSKRIKSDRLSDLPDCVLLHIMKFLNLKAAVRTSVLSKRLKDLWKRLTDITLHSSDFRRLFVFTKSVSSILSCRDDSISLHNLDFSRRGYCDTKLLNRVMTYAALHDVQQLTIRVELCWRNDFQLPASVFHSPSLTCLKLSFGSLCDPDNMIKLP